ncbi:TPA: hypothetical protein DF272_06845 [Candidatus Falkowbacteria bacterium]|nr:hypothetical protein [Candidatus Falkowbacteria bacterium]
MENKRNIFITLAGGNVAAERHFYETIQNKKGLDEIRQFLSPEERSDLISIYHSSPFIVWGATPGKMNDHFWKQMKPGDQVMIVNNGKIKFVGEIATKTKNKTLANHFWGNNNSGNTWELIYFIVNEKIVNIPFSKVGVLFGYNESFKPRGFSKVNDENTEKFYQLYGDLFGVVENINNNNEIQPINKVEVVEILKEKIEHTTTEHDEMQWRLIRLGTLAGMNIWIPKNDQNKKYEGCVFKEKVMREFHISLDVPPTITNIDVVWKFGMYSIKSAFEIEHSTAVYSGILRLSDLRSETPNSTFPLFLVAAETRRSKIISELSRPTFSGPCLRLNEVIRYLSYDMVRKVDNSVKDGDAFEVDALLNLGEKVGAM